MPTKRAELLKVRCVSDESSIHDAVYLGEWEGHTVRFSVPGVGHFEATASESMRHKVACAVRVTAGQFTVTQCK